MLRNSFWHFLALSFVFCIIEGLEWVAMDPSKRMPRGCHKGGKENSTNYKGPLYIGRKQIDNELVIGKVVPSWKNAYFPKDGGEHAADHFEVLCGGGQIWWRSKPEIQKTNFLYAVAGGRAGDGEPFYVCKAKLDDFQTPGKLYKPTGCCYVSSYGKEHCKQDYFVMVTDFALD